MTGDSTTGRERFEELVRRLEEPGHRGSATEREAEAARLLAEELTSLGLEVRTEPFRGSSSLGGRLVVHVLLASLGFASLWSSPWVAAAVALVALVSLRWESSTRGRGLSRLVGSPESRNVVARAPATGGERTRAVVVCAHVDSQRTGWMWTGRLVHRLSALYQVVPGPMRSPMFPVVAAMASHVALGLALGLWPEERWLLWASAPIGLVYLVAAVVLGQWARGPFVPGAADNATGAAAAVELAERWLAEPVPGVELVVVLSGCEESGCLGAVAYLEAHAADLDSARDRFLVLDTFAYGAPRFISTEHSLAAVPYRYSPTMMRLCADSAESLDLRDAGPHVLPTFTDGVAFRERGFEGVALLSFEEGVSMPNYHQLTDTSDRMDFDVGWQSVDFAWDVLRRLASE